MQDIEKNYLYVSISKNASFKAFETSNYFVFIKVVMKKIGAGEMESSSDSGTTNARVLLNDFRRRLKSSYFKIFYIFIYISLFQKLMK